MTAPPIKVDILAGQNTAITELQRTGKEMAVLATGASTGLSPVQKFSKALVLSEAREGTLALRALRTGFTDLAISATGAGGPLVRVIEGIGGLGIGGPLMLAVTGGIAALALGYEKLTSSAREAAAETKKLKEEIKALVAGTPEAKQLHRGAQILTTQDELEKITGQLPKLRLHYEELKNFAGEHAKRTQDAAVALEKATREAERLRAVLYDLKQPGTIAPIEVATTENFQAYSAATRARLRRAAAQFDLTPVADTRLRREPRGRFGELPEAEDKGRVPVDALTGVEKRERGRDVDLAVGAAMSVISGVARGGAAGAIGGLGSAATALRGVSGAPAFLGPLGIGLSALSSITSLFSGKQQIHVMIDGYDSHALSQQQQLMLALTGFKGLSVDILSAGGDVDRILNALGRKGRTDGMLRIPPGG